MHTHSTMGSRLVGALKLQVSFTKEPYNRDLYSAKETYNLKEPTNCSHPIVAKEACSITCDLSHQLPFVILLYEFNISMRTTGGVERA